MKNIEISQNEAKLIILLLSEISETLKNQNPKPLPSPKFVTVSRVAKLLGVTPKTIYSRLSKNHKNPLPIPSIRRKGSNRVFFNEADVHAYLNGQSASRKGGGS